MSSCRCPVCGRPQRFLDDEWPDQCVVCGYEWTTGEDNEDRRQSDRARLVVQQET